MHLALGSWIISSGSVSGYRHVPCWPILGSVSVIVLIVHVREVSD